MTLHWNCVVPGTVLFDSLSKESVLVVSRSSVRCSVSLISRLVEEYISFVFLTSKDGDVVDCWECIRAPDSEIWEFTDIEFPVPGGGGET